MQRRKFLATVGSLAAGSAAAMGTGAFSSVRAERSLNVALADDSTAYLALDASESVYANETSGGELELVFDGSKSGQNGSGLNQNADTIFKNVFRVENQGKNDVRVNVFPPGTMGDLPYGPMVVWGSSDAQTGSSAKSLVPFPASPSSKWDGGKSYDNATHDFQDLTPGDDLYVHFGFYLNDATNALEEIDVDGDGNIGDNTASTDIEDVPEQLGIYAEAVPEDDEV